MDRLFPHIERITRTLCGAGLFALTYWIAKDWWQANAAWAAGWATATTVGYYLTEGRGAEHA